MRGIVAYLSMSGGGAIAMWQTIKREELYEEVWSAPLTQLGAKYGLSDNGLRKVCKRLNVPFPEGGAGRGWTQERR